MFFPDKLSRAIARSLRDHPEDWTLSHTGVTLHHKNGDYIWIGSAAWGLDVIPKGRSLLGDYAYEVDVFPGASQRHIYQAYKRWLKRDLNKVIKNVST